ncbi:MAG: hypothetical protein HUJ11_05445 [Arenibacter algicola]|nr:hypothetical protein [Arenibacter algicola]
MNRDDTFICKAKAFLSCIRNGETPMVSGEDGLSVLKMALAAKQSAATNKTVLL